MQVFNGSGESTQAHVYTVRPFIEISLFSPFNELRHKVFNGFREVRRELNSELVPGTLGRKGQVRQCVFGFRCFVRHVLLK